METSLFIAKIQGVEVGKIKLVRIGTCPPPKFCVIAIIGDSMGVF